MDKFTEMIVGQASSHSRRKVLAGIVLSKDGDVMDEMEVISVTTGTKCINGEHMSVNGNSLNGNHIYFKRFFKRKIPNWQKKIWEKLDYFSENRLNFRAKNRICFVGNLTFLSFFFFKISRQNVFEKREKFQKLQFFYFPEQTWKNPKKYWKKNWAWISSFLNFPAKMSFQKALNFQKYLIKNWGKIWKKKNRNVKALDTTKNRIAISREKYWFLYFTQNWCRGVFKKLKITILIE